MRWLLLLLVLFVGCRPTEETVKNHAGFLAKEKHARIMAVHPIVGENTDWNFMFVVEGLETHQRTMLGQRYDSAEEFPVVGDVWELGMWDCKTLKLAKRVKELE